MKLISKLLSVVIFAALIFVIYKFFFDCEHFYVQFNEEFTLSLLDYAKIEDEAYVKLLKINDHSEINENGDREGQIEYKLLVVNDMRINYVTLSTLENKEVEINKTKYTLKLTNGIDDTKASFKLLKEEEEDKK